MAVAAERKGRARAQSARCPLRPGDPCSLCVPGATGPQDCPLVYLVMHDPELREEWRRRGRFAKQGPGAAH